MDASSCFSNVSSVTRSFLKRDNSLKNQVVIKLKMRCNREVEILMVADEPLDMMCLAAEIKVGVLMPEKHSSLSKERCNDVEILTEPH